MTQDIMPLYEDYIDKKKTIKLMKAHLEFLRKHIHSISFEDYQSLKQDSLASYLQYLKEQEFLIHEDTMGYLNYNKGVVSFKDHPMKCMSSCTIKEGISILDSKTLKKK